MTRAKKLLCTIGITIAFAGGAVTTPAAAEGHAPAVAPQDEAMPVAPSLADAPATASAAASGATVTVHYRGDGAQPPAELGNPSEWGVVTFKMDASAESVSPLSEACVNASGGKWCYGWYITGVASKYCYSNYLHQTEWHHSTVKIAGKTAKGVAAPGDASHANITAGAAYTCSTYYSVD
ncbi:lactococcin 972 family bacteriocin [Streptomyces sp. NRRL S-646]|uniref:lactococcin 972 family bacteriocin n=1 Tax=Streptomyces sp. NRRL S-646 TaxID=1463917 RepID=UPI00099D10C0|nr:lactococcin 972 family bacteriocin [Streptomyces sp. NRRL S-646]